MLHRAREIEAASRGTRRCARRWCLRARTSRGTSASSPTSSPRTRFRPGGRVAHAAARQSSSVHDPAAFVLLDAFPLTPNGKVDRKAAAGATGGASNRARLVAPRSELEQRIATVWREVLHLEQVGAKTISSIWAATRC